MMKYDKVEGLLSRDKAQTEFFIEHLIITLSNMIILVVGKLTRTEQRLRTKIKTMAKGNENKINSIIIVHNLAQYNKKTEVERHIDDYLKNSATFKINKKQVIGIDEYSDRFYFVEDAKDNNELEISHKISVSYGICSLRE